MTARLTTMAMPYQHMLILMLIIDVYPCLASPVEVLWLSATTMQSLFSCLCLKPMQPAALEVDRVEHFELAMIPSSSVVYMIKNVFYGILGPSLQGYLLQISRVSHVDLRVSTAWPLSEAMSKDPRETVACEILHPLHTSNVYYFAALSNLSTYRSCTHKPLPQPFAISQADNLLPPERSGG